MDRELVPTKEEEASLADGGFSRTPKQNENKVLMAGFAVVILCVAFGTHVTTKRLIETNQVAQTEFAELRFLVQNLKQQLHTEDLQQTQTVPSTSISPPAPSPLPATTPPPITQETAVVHSSGSTTRQKQLLYDVVARGLMYLLYIDNTSEDQMNPIFKLWPEKGLSMGGRETLDNIFQLTDDVISRGIPGDMIESGTWRGANGIAFKFALEANGDTTRHIWLLDTFSWVPPPDTARFSQDRGDQHSRQVTDNPSLLNEASEENVAKHFSRFGFPIETNRVHLVKGLFKDTAPGLSQQVTSVAILRLDGDMYSSTWEILYYFYDRVEIGGYVIVDDYGLPGCRKAIHDFLECISLPKNVLITYQRQGSKVYWQKKGQRKPDLPCFTLPDAES